MNQVQHLPTAFERAMTLMLGKYPSAMTPTMAFAAFEQELEEFAPEVQEQALRLAPRFHRSRPPSAGEVRTLAEAIERWGVTATELAGKRWYRSVKPDSAEASHYGPTPARLAEAVAMAFREVGNPDRRPAALLGQPRAFDEMGAEPVTEEGKRVQESIMTRLREGAQPHELAKALAEAL